jgi:hypothetical protein
MGIKSLPTIVIDSSTWKNKFRKCLKKHSVSGWMI